MWSVVGELAEDVGREGVGGVLGGWVRVYSQFAQSVEIIASVNLLFAKVLNAHRLLFLFIQYVVEYVFAFVGSVFYAFVAYFIDGLIERFVGFF